MSLADDVRKELKKLTEHKAFYAAAGAGDLAVQTLRTLPDRLARWQEKTDLTALSGLAFEYVMLAGAHAVQTYDELADRGMSLIHRVNTVNRQQAAAQLEQAARSTARATVRTANRTADAARKTAQTTARVANQATAQAALQAAAQAGQAAAQAAGQVAAQAGQVAGRTKRTTPAEIASSGQGGHAAGKASGSAGKASGSAGKASGSSRQPSPARLPRVEAESRGSSRDRGRTRVVPACRPVRVESPQAP